MSGLIDVAQNLCDNMNSKVNSNASRRIFYKPITYKDSIIKIYGTYEGPKDFLRIPSGDKVDKILTSQNCVFLGAYLDGHLAGISCIKEKSGDYPFFRFPKSENPGKVFTFGGLYVRPECQGFGSAKGMVEILTESTRQYTDILKNQGVSDLHRGIFYEADYRNASSLSVLTRHGNYVGYYVDDKRLEGPTIMLYDSFTQKPVDISYVPRVHISPDKEEGVEDLFHFTSDIAEQVGGMQKYELPFDDQANTMYVLNNIPRTAGMGKSMLDFEKEYVDNFNFYAPGEATSVLLSGSDYSQQTVSSEDMSGQQEKTIDPELLDLDTERNYDATTTCAGTLVHPSFLGMVDGCMSRVYKCARPDDEQILN